MSVAVPSTLDSNFPTIGLLLPSSKSDSLLNAYLQGEEEEDNDDTCNSIEGYASILYAKHFKSAVDGKFHEQSTFISKHPVMGPFVLSVLTEQVGKSSLDTITSVHETRVVLVRSKYGSSLHKSTVSADKNEGVWSFLDAALLEYFAPSPILKLVVDDFRAAGETVPSLAEDCRTYTMTYMKQIKGKHTSLPKKLMDFDRWKLYAPVLVRVNDHQRNTSSPLSEVLRDNCVDPWEYLISDLYNSKLLRDLYLHDAYGPEAKLRFTAPSSSMNPNGSKSLLAAFNELLSSERSYLQNLQSLKTNYLEPLKNSAPESSFERKMIPSVDKILELSENLLYILEKTKVEQSNDASEEMCRILFERLPLFVPHYNEYVKSVTAFENAVLKSDWCRQVLDEIESKSVKNNAKSFRRFSDSFKEPVQRTYRYRLLFADVSTNSMDSSTLLPLFIQMFNAAHEFASSVNESVRAPQLEKINFDLGLALGCAKEFGSAGLKFLADYEFRDIHRDLDITIMLCNRKLIVLKRNQKVTSSRIKEDKYSFLYEVPFDGLWVLDTYDPTDLEFKLISISDKNIAQECAYAAKNQCIKRAFLSQMSHLVAMEQFKRHYNITSISLLRASLYSFKPVYINWSKNCHSAPRSEERILVNLLPPSSSSEISPSPSNSAQLAVFLFNVQLLDAENVTVLKIKPQCEVQDTPPSKATLNSTLASLPDALLDFALLSSRQTLDWANVNKVWKEQLLQIFCSNINSKYIGNVSKVAKSNSGAGASVLLRGLSAAESIKSSKGSVMSNFSVHSVARSVHKFFRRGVDNFGMASPHRPFAAQAPKFPELQNNNHGSVSTDGAALKTTSIVGGSSSRGLSRILPNLNTSHSKGTGNSQPEEGYEFIRRSTTPLSTVVKMLCDEIEFKGLGNPKLYEFVRHKEEIRHVLHRLCDYGFTKENLNFLRESDCITLTSSLSAILTVWQLFIPREALYHLDDFLKGEILVENEKLSDSATVPVCRVLAESLCQDLRDALYCIFRHFRRLSQMSLPFRLIFLQLNATIWRGLVNKNAADQITLIFFFHLESIFDGLVSEPFLVPGKLPEHLSLHSQALDSMTVIPEEDEDEKVAQAEKPKEPHPTPPIIDGRMDRQDSQTPLPDRPKARVLNAFDSAATLSMSKSCPTLPPPVSSFSSTRVIKGRERVTSIKRMIKTASREILFKELQEQKEEMENLAKGVKSFVIKATVATDIFFDAGLTKSRSRSMVDLNSDVHSEDFESCDEGPEVDAAGLKAIFTMEKLLTGDGHSKVQESGKEGGPTSNPLEHTDSAATNVEVEADEAHNVVVI